MFLNRLLAGTYHEKTRMIILIAVSLLIAVPFVVNICKRAERQKELNELNSYEVYSTYAAARDSFWVFVMCNPEYPLSDIMVSKLSDDYFRSLKSKIDGATTSNCSAKIFMMLPSKELPYGWEKDEVTISLNFDLSIFHRRTAYIITIPYGADSIDECNIEYREHPVLNNRLAEMLTEREA